jgi:hypothetical protein
MPSDALGIHSFSISRSDVRIVGVIHRGGDEKSRSQFRKVVYYLDETSDLCLLTLQPKDSR